MDLRQLGRDRGKVDLGLRGTDRNRSGTGRGKRIRYVDPDITTRPQDAQREIAREKSRGLS